MRNLLIVLLAFCFSQSFAWAQKKENVSCRVISATQDADAVHNGVLYWLPKTVIRVQVDADLVVRKAGPFFRYSQKYLNISEVVKEDETVWQIVGVSLDGVGYPDDSQVYKIITDGYGSAPMVNLTPLGIICGINSCPSNNECSLPGNTISYTAPIVSFDEVPLGEEVLTKTSSAAMAEEAAFAIYRLRKKRTDLLGSESGKVAGDGVALQSILEEINRLETAYVSLFKGAEKRLRVTRYFDFVADAANPVSNVLLRFSPQKGLLDRMDVSGTPVYIDVIPLEKKALNVVPTGAKRSDEVNGLRYILPGRALVKLTDRNVPLLEQEMLLSQFGQVATLPVSLLQQSGVQIKICPVTGALLQINRQTSK